MNGASFHLYRERSVKALFLTGVLISFLGWLWEMLCAAFILQSPNDRGFLILPFCPIYGVSVIAIYLLFHTPNDMKILGRSIPQMHPLWRYITYYILAGFSATVFELLTGLFFDKIFHVRLWSYKDYFGNIGGYIALFPSLSWGIAITIFMRLVFYPLFRMIQEYPPHARTVLFRLFLFLITADCFFNFSYLLLNGKWFNLNFLFQ